MPENYVCVCVCVHRHSCAESLVRCDRSNLPNGGRSVPNTYASFPHEMYELASHLACAKLRTSPSKFLLLVTESPCAMCFYARVQQ